MSRRPIDLVTNWSVTPPNYGGCRTEIRKERKPGRVELERVPKESIQKERDAPAHAIGLNLFVDSDQQTPFR